MSEGSATSAATAADLVIAELAASEAALIAENRELAADREVYRLIVQAALGELARLSPAEPPEDLS